ncbi:MAG: sterol desaturase family protein [Gammaproteobacteria bacterium]|nr:sterol desaturase family protein [Gammaproteobacteria bacterium]MYD75879.1 sterol desaturase family protein [Gammaproteobacteria bacterium]MYJ52648.1 sterol desaturase family protein [Gammaproteobacteria bacterium]
MLETLSVETVLRIGAFTLVAVIMGLWEMLLPRRQGSRRFLRWPGNFGIFLINAVMLALLPITAVGAAIFSIQHKFGMLYWIEMAFWPKVILCILVLDLLIYWQHRLFHMMPSAWRIHRMHHTDTAFDFTTALRFHPIEIFLSILIKAAAIILLGAPVFAVIAFEIILNGSAMFNHGNVVLPKALDRPLRWLVVTPDMHRVHHSPDPDEHNMNYGFFLSVWDRIFGSYRDQPRQPHADMQIGLTVFNQDREARVDRLITQPFRKHRSYT